MVSIGYAFLGYCMFGTYAESFVSWFAGAQALIAVIHGDSIKLMFDEVAVNMDISVWAGVIYWVIWIFFSLTIMFNISISIFEEALIVDLDKKPEDEEELDRPFGSFTLPVPLKYCRLRTDADY